MDRVQFRRKHSWLLAQCLLVLLVLALLAIPLSHLFRPASPSVLVGMVDSGAEQEWDTLMMGDILRSLTDEGITVHHFSGNCRQDVQIQAIRSLIRQEADYIILFPIVDTGWQDILQEAADAGVALITVGRTVSYQEQPDHFRSHIGISQYKAAYQLTETLAAQVHAPTTMVELVGNENSTLTRERRQGILDTLNARHLLRLTETVAGSDDQTTAKALLSQRMDEWLASGELPQVLLTHSGELALSTIQVLEEYGLEPGVDIRIATFDATPQTLQELAAGRISHVLASSYRYGQLVLQIIREREKDPLPYYQMIQDTQVLSSTVR